MNELIKNFEPVVLIDINKEKIDKCDTMIENLLSINGDCSDDQILIDAGIKKASGIIITLASDKDNLYVTMTARMLNPDIRIISRMANLKIEPKLINAGADKVVSPNFIGALRMASEMIRPTAVDFLDKMLRSNKGNLRIHELRISEGSKIKGKKISESKLKDEFGLLILGSKKPGEDDIVFNPPISQELSEHMTLIVMGDVKNINRAKQII